MGVSGLDRTDDFQKFCRSGLDQIQLLGIRIGLGLKNFTVCSSLLDCKFFSFLRVAQMLVGCKLLAQALKQASKVSKSFSSHCVSFRSNSDNHHSVIGSVSV